MASGLPHFEKGEIPSKEKLRSALNASAQAIEVMIRHSWNQGGRVSGFRRGLIPLVGYLIAHEAHHRGGILLTLKQSRHRLPDDLRWGLWDWNKI